MHLKRNTLTCCTMKETTDLKGIDGLLFLVEQHFNQKIGFTCRKFYKMKLYIMALKCYNLSICLHQSFLICICPLSGHLDKLLIFNK